MRERFREATAQRAQRPSGDRFQRKWLQLRLGAWQRQSAVTADVTPDLLRVLDITHCPVTREPLTQGLLADSDRSVDRLNNDAGHSTMAVGSTDVARPARASSR